MHTPFSLCVDAIEGILCALSGIAHTRYKGVLKDCHDRRDLSLFLSSMARVEVLGTVGRVGRKRRTLFASKF